MFYTNKEHKHILQPNKYYTLLQYRTVSILIQYVSFLSIMSMLSILLFFFNHNYNNPLIDYNTLYVCNRSVVNFLKYKNIPLEVKAFKTIIWLKWAKTNQIVNLNYWKLVLSTNIG